MIFVIERASIWGTAKPIPEAKQRNVPCWECRTVTESEFDRKFGKSEGLWRSKGTNHLAVTPGYKVSKKGSHIVRKVEDRKEWTVDIDPKDIMSFVEKYGRIIIGTWYADHTPIGYGEPIYAITIYDDYIE